MSASTIILNKIVLSKLKPPGTPPTKEIVLPSFDRDGVLGHKLKIDFAKLKSLTTKFLSLESNTISPSTVLIEVFSVSTLTLTIKVSPTETVFLAVSK